MTDRHSFDDFGSKLLQQDEVLRSTRYEEHRMQLKQQLAQAEYRERLAKRVVIGAFIVSWGLIPVIASRVFGGADPYDKDATVLSVAVGATQLVAGIVATIGVASYYSRFRPRVHRLREELQNESIDELRREIRELRDLLGSSSQAGRADQSGQDKH